MQEEYAIGKSSKSDKPTAPPYEGGEGETFRRARIPTSCRAHSVAVGLL
jgi:hypothetical protein